MSMVGYVLLTLLASTGAILLADWIKGRINGERRPARRRSLK